MYYSSSELKDRILNVMTLLQVRLAEDGIKAEPSEGWYKFTLVITEGSNSYPALSVGEDHEDNLFTVTFYTICDLDDKLLYRGVTIEEGLPNLIQELYEETLRQNSWVKQVQKQREEKRQREVESMQLLADLLGEFPEFDKCIQRVSSDPPVFELHLRNLSIENLREVLQKIRPSYAQILSSHPQTPR
jgi:hypothetical protein